MGIRNSGGGSKAPMNGVHVAIGASNEAALMWCRSNGFVQVEGLGEGGLRVEESAQCSKEAKKEDDEEERDSKEKGRQPEQKQEKHQGHDPKWMVKKLMMK